MGLGDLNELEKIGLAFISGIAAGCSLKKATDEEDEVEDEPIKKVEIQKVTPKEMGKVLDDLKNKIMGGK